MKIQNKNSWYTILITLMIIGFLMVLTTWVFNLVLRELNDNRWAWNYLKAHAWAEAAMELALLDIKNNWYGVYNKKSDLEYFDKIKISYDLNSKTKEYIWKIWEFKQSVIPLFYSEVNWNINKIDSLNLEILDYWINSNNSKLAWNIISSSWDWIWWVWEIDNNTKWDWRKWDWSYLDKVKVSDFLNNHDWNYLIIVNLFDDWNLNNDNLLEFKLSSQKEFTKPISKIFSTASIWRYKQNLETTLDNTEFLSILKYSIFSK